MLVHNLEAYVAAPPPPPSSPARSEGGEPPSGGAGDAAGTDRVPKLPPDILEERHKAGLARRGKYQQGAHDAGWRSPRRTASPLRVWEPHQGYPQWPQWLQLSPQWPPMCSPAAWGGSTWQPASAPRSRPASDSPRQPEPEADAPPEPEAPRTKSHCRPPTQPPTFAWTRDQSFDGKSMQAEGDRYYWGGKGAGKDSAAIRSSLRADPFPFGDRRRGEVKAKKKAKSAPSGSAKAVPGSTPGSGSAEAVPGSTEDAPGRHDALEEAQMRALGADPVPHRARRVEAAKPKILAQMPAHVKIREAYMEFFRLEVKTFGVDQYKPKLKSVSDWCWAVDDQTAELVDCRNAPRF
jgi:hypothetical protein